MSQTGIFTGDKGDRNVKQTSHLRKVTVRMRRALILRPFSSRHGAQLERNRQFEKITS